MKNSIVQISPFRFDLQSNDYKLLEAVIHLNN